MSTCQYISNKKCIHKCKYGNFCYKHRRNYLVKENIIDEDKFTGLSKDYLKSDMIKYYREKLNKKNGSTLSKKDLFNEIRIYIDNLNSYKINLDKIIIIQNFLRKYNENKKKLCNNKEDFYTYEDIIDIPNKYFYSYVDKSNIRWGFDLRSLEKLFTMNNINPYTTEIIDKNIVNNIQEKIKKLKFLNEYEDLITNEITDKLELLKQKIVDLFSDIENSSYSCNIEWFNNLSTRRLKILYKELEDLWNYRSQLSESSKRRICPPDANIFKTPLTEVMHYNNKEELQSLIIHEVSKFMNAEQSSDKKLGYMYFLIALSYVSQECYISHSNWLSFIY